MPCVNSVTRWRVYALRTKYQIIDFSLPAAKVAALIAPRRKFMTVIQEDCIRVRGQTWPEYSEILTRVSACRRTARVPRITSLSAVVFLPRVHLSKYRGAPLYGSVPINHLTHGPTIRLLERESYYPARLW